MNKFLSVRSVKLVTNVSALVLYHFKEGGYLLGCCFVN